MLTKMSNTRHPLVPDAYPVLVKNRTRRRLGVWMRNPLAVGSGVLTIAGSAVSILVGVIRENETTAITIGIATFAAAGILTRIAIRRDSASQNKYFSRVLSLDVEAGHAQEILAAIAQGVSATPEFSAVAPEPDELKVVLDELVFRQVAYITGGPGEGKSTLAYQAARALADDGYTVYRLTGSFLVDQSREYMRDTLLAQADSLRGAARLIIVDDAHLLDRPGDVRDILERVLEDDDTSLIWIWTEEGNDDAIEIPNPIIRINYSRLAPKLVEFFGGNAYHGGFANSPSSIREANKMSESGVITTAWQYSFVAFEGSRRLTASIGSLTNLQLISLFVLSARTVATGSIQIAVPRAQSILDIIEVGWVRDDLRVESYGEVLRSLSRRTGGHAPFLHFQVGRLGPEVACLHYNFAREVIHASLKRAAITDDLIRGFAQVLVNLGEYVRYPGILCLAIGSYLGMLVAAAEDFFRDCLQGRTLSHAAAIAKLFDALVRQRFDSRIEEFLKSLDAGPLAERISESRAIEFAGAAGIIRYSRVLVLFNVQLIQMLDISSLATTAKSIQLTELSALAYLLRELGERREEFIDKLDLTALSVRTNSASATQFRSVAELLRALGTKRERLIRKLDITMLGSTASNAQAAELGTVAALVRELGVRRQEFVRGLDVIVLASTVKQMETADLGSAAELLQALGPDGGELIDKLDIGALAATASRARASEFAAIADWTRVLRGRREEFIGELDVSALAATASRARANEFAAIADLVRVLGQRRGEFIKKLDFSALAETASLAPAVHLGRVASFLRALAGGRELFIIRLDLDALATTISEADSAELGAVGDLLRDVGRRRTRLLAEPTLTALVTTASNARPAEFWPVASLLRALDTRRGVLLNRLDLNALAGAASRAQAAEFSGVAFLLRELDSRRDDMVRVLDVTALAPTASRAKTGQLQGMGELLAELGDRRGELVDRLDLNMLAATISHAQASELGASTYLLRELGGRRAELVGGLDLNALATTISHAQAGELRGAADFLRELSERREELAARLDLDVLAMTVSHAQAVELGRAGDLLQELEEWAEGLLDRIDIPVIAATVNRSQERHLRRSAHLLKELRRRRGDIVDGVDLTSLVNKVLGISAVDS